MSSRVLAGLLVAGCVAAAAGGGYLAVRQNAVQPVPVAASPAPPTAATPATEAGSPVSETEAVVSSGTAKPKAEAEPATRSTSSPSARPSVSPVREAPRPAAPATRREPAPSMPAAKTRPMPTASSAPTPPPAAEKSAAPAPVATQAERIQEPVRTSDPPAPKIRQFEEVVLPSSSVIGLEVDTALSSERARVEDRVDAKVSRDVLSEGHVVIPAGSRVIGSVTMVDRGGKVKTPARLGVRFHTLVLADGREVQLGTEPIYREGEAPGPDSARKIGGAAVGGAILGAILGGGKGAAIGGAAGAAGGSAIVMAGDRSAATLSPGTIVNVHLSAPVTLEVEKRDQQQ